MKVAGRKIDIGELVIVAVCETVLLGLGSAVIHWMIESDGPRVAAFVALLIAIVAAPVFYLYGPPWSTKQPQRPVTLFGGARQTTEEPPAEPAAASDTSGESDQEPSSNELQRQIVVERANARRWEYSYLNIHLVATTQYILDWLYPQKEFPPARVWFDVKFSGLEDSEREAIVRVLYTHHLIMFDKQGNIQITPKGCEYVEFRGVGIGEVMAVKEREGAKAALREKTSSTETHATNSA